MKTQKMIKKLLMLTVLGSQFSFNTSILGMEEEKEVAGMDIEEPSFFAQAQAAVPAAYANINDLPDEMIGTILSNMTNLKDIYRFIGTSKRFANIAKVWVTRLDFSSNLTDANLGNIVKRFPYLRTLTISYNKQITGAGLAHLSRLFYLKNLMIYLCKSINDEDLIYLTNLPLEYLDFSGCTLISDKGLANLTQIDPETRLPKLIILEYLDMKGCNITDEGLAYVARLSNLKVLCIRNCMKITDAGIERYLRPLIDKGLIIQR